jgi:uncharacterized protein (UPF0332 family)
MAFDWKEFIKFSEELYDSRNDEASLRSAISRAYYGAFGAIRPYCTHKFQIPSKSNHEIHRMIIERLKSSSDRLEYSTGNLLSGNNADYDGSSSITKPIVNKAIHSSKAVISNLENLRKQL